MTYGNVHRITTLWMEPFLTLLSFDYVVSCSVAIHDRMIMQPMDQQLQIE